jgi:glycerol-3-phosphate dehydrogenase (NAD(P)+)
MRQHKNHTIGIIGSGSWGTALAQALIPTQHKIVLYGRNRDVIQEINVQNTNTAYLPYVTLSDKIHATTDPKILQSCDIWLVAIPAQEMRSGLKALLPYWEQTKPPLILAAKGIEKETGLLVEDIAKQVTPDAHLAILSGPSFAKEVALNYPTALTLACEDKALLDALQTILSSKAFRLYTTPDIIGCQVAGSLKNVLAIAAGIVIGKGLGENARAALITRGLFEMSLLGQKMGALNETFFGLSGLGDLLLTAMSNQSRNTLFGIYIGQGLSKEEAVLKQPKTTEGVHTAASLQILMNKYQIDMPISSIVYQILEKNMKIKDAIDALLARPLKSEHILKSERVSKAS